MSQAVSQLSDTQSLPALPIGWVWTRLGKISEINPGFQDDLPEELEVSFVPMRCVEEVTGKVDLSLSRALAQVRKGYTAFRNGDIIFAKITPCMENGKTAIVDNLRNGIGFGSTEFHVIRLIDKQIPRSLIFFFLVQEGFRRDAQMHMTGSAGQLRVPAGYIQEVSIPLPPLPEQDRIVAKIEELFTRLDASVEALRKIKTQLKRYRQAVLRDAFQGKLTQEWREAHKGELEPASTLLEHIREKHRKRTGGKYRELLPLGRSDIPELPEGWVYLTLDYLVSNDRNAIKRGPFGSSIRKEFFVPRGYKVYEQGNVIHDDFERGSYFIDDRKFDELKDFEVKTGDVLMSCSGTVGKIAIVPERVQPGVINQALLKVTLDSGVVDTLYFTYLLKSKIDEIMLENTRGSAMINISSVKALRQIPLAIASLTEQHRIVEEIERRLSIADNIEKTVDQSLHQAGRLRQSILKRAFEGKLVPQDPDDEPAEKLLERIRKEGEQQH